MKESEVFIMPWSGVVLTKHANYLRCYLPGGSCGIELLESGGAAIVRPFREDIWCGSFERAVADLDAWIIETRAALMPADARERIANVLGPGGYERADAVLRALGMGVKS